MKPELGYAIGLLDFINSRASTTFIFCVLMRKAMINVVDLDLPAKL